MINSVQLDRFLDHVLQADGGDPNAVVLFTMKYDKFEELFNGSALDLQFELRRLCIKHRLNMQAFNFHGQRDINIRLTKQIPPRTENSPSFY